jgi:hypothetical protein
MTHRDKASWWPNKGAGTGTTEANLAVGSLAALAEQSGQLAILALHAVNRDATDLHGRER